MTFRTRTNRIVAATSDTRRSPAALLALVVGLSGCSGGPEALPMPSYDPAGTAQRAMEMYDTDGDGYVAEEEVENAPGLKAALKNLDTDKNGKVSEEEIAERVRAWDRMQIGVMSFTCNFYLNGKMLADAEVTFDPEEFMGGAVQPAVGVTSMGGDMIPRVPKEKRPSPNSPSGMQAGIYKVRVSKIVDGEETIPAKYNTETILGQEVALDDWAIVNRRVVFKLKSK